MTEERRIERPPAPDTSTVPVVPTAAPGSVNIHFGGNVHGNVAANAGGGNLTQINKTSNASAEDVATLRQLLADFKAEVAEAAPADKKEMARGLASELEETALSENPEKGTLEFLRDWFFKNAPAMAGSLATVLGHPILGQVLGSAGRGNSSVAE